MKKGFFCVEGPGPAAEAAGYRCQLTVQFSVSEGSPKARVDDWQGKSQLKPVPGSSAILPSTKIVRTGVKAAAAGLGLKTNVFAVGLSLAAVACDVADGVGLVARGMSLVALSGTAIVGGATAAFGLNGGIAEIFIAIFFDAAGVGDFTVASGFALASAAAAAAAALAASAFCCSSVLTERAGMSAGTGRLT